MIEQCTCPHDREGYVFDTATRLYVHAVCGRPRTGGPTRESVAVFVDRVLRERRERQRGSL